MELDTYVCKISSKGNGDRQDEHVLTAWRGTELKHTIHVIQLWLQVCHIQLWVYKHSQPAR